MFFDGRSDLYGDDFAKKYQEVIDVRWDWEAILSQYRVHTIVLPVGDALSSALKLSPHWRAVYDDGTAIIFRSTVARNTVVAATLRDNQVPAVQYGGFSAVADGEHPNP